MQKKAKNYLSTLAIQYTQTTGDILTKQNHREFFMRMVNWYVELDTSSKLLYKEILNNYLNYSLNGVVEVGKGVLDTITNPRMQTTILTPFTSDFNQRRDQRTIMNGELHIINGTPYRDNINNDDSLAPEIIQTNNYLITHNPYSLEEIEDWFNLHNIGTKIAIGMYGKNNDKNLELKLEILKMIKDKLNGEYIEDTRISGEDYAYLIASKRSLKR